MGYGYSRPNSILPKKFLNEFFSGERMVVLIKNYHRHFWVDLIGYDADYDILFLGFRKFKQYVCAYPDVKKMIFRRIVNPSEKANVPKRNQTKYGYIRGTNKKAIPYPSVGATLHKIGLVRKRLGNYTIIDRNNPGFKGGRIVFDGYKGVPKFKVKDFYKGKQSITNSKNNEAQPIDPFFLELMKLFGLDLNKGEN